jgi:C1A family cysteine protease
MEIYPKLISMYHKLMMLVFPLLIGGQSAYTVAQSTYGTGAILENNTPNTTKKNKIRIFGIKKKKVNYNQTVPSNYSLEKFLPEIGEQGDLGSCVGWATTYYGLTIVKKIEKSNSSSVFSPLSVYNRYSFQEKRDPCAGGAEINKCLELLKEKGSPKVTEYDMPYCAKDERKKPYSDKLFNYERIQHNNAFQIKYYLTNDCPVVVGMMVYAGGKGNSLNSKFLDSLGVIQIDNFSNDYAVAGHALCIVGFDDNIAGGAFKIVNSWGESWGKDGFCWIKYSDLDILKCAYAMIPSKEKSKRFL